MIKPELFDIVELIVNLPEYQQFIGSQGAIVECHDDHILRWSLAMKKEKLRPYVTYLINNLLLCGNRQRNNGYPPAIKSQQLLIT